MSLSTIYQQNDIGISLISTIYQPNGVAQNISAASGLNFYLFRPSQDYLTYSGEFYTNGNDGQIQYTTTSGDLSEAGIYRYQSSYFITPNVLIYSQKVPFLVEPNP